MILRKVKMDALKQKTKRQIMSEFYETHNEKWKEFTFTHFRCVGLKKTPIFGVMKIDDSVK